ncbi:MAG: hypothetical protein ABSD74_18520 [Rhizomicrobium sp.]|jgi:hypothetical protein
MSQFRGRVLSASLLAFTCALLSTAADANAPKPGLGLKHHAGAWLKPYRSPHEGVTSGTWAEVTTFPGSGPDTSLLMMNGTVITHDLCTGQWYRLSPDASGNYADGTWSKIGAMPSGYTPLYFASQVLPNGNVIMNGGEYNTGCQDDHTTKGAWYDAPKNKWYAVSPPTGWGTIGDAESMVLQSGTYMLSDCCNEDQALAAIGKKGKVTWTATGSGKADDNNEEGWTLLPNGEIFAVDVWLGAPNHAELYNPSSGTWSATTTAPVGLSDPDSFELGPALLLPNGTVFQEGTNPCAKNTCASHSATYNPTNATWTQGPDLPQVGGDYYTTEDAPASVLPDGNVLAQLSPSYVCSGGAFCSPSHFFEYNGSTWTQVSDPVSGQAASDASYEGRLLPLPNGQILWTSDQGDIEVYTPVGSPNGAWLPTITSVSSTLTLGQKNIALTGTQLTGVGDGGKYGDDAQMDEKYPLVRISNNSSGAVCFATTTAFSPTSATFTLAKKANKKTGATVCQTGASELEVVVNGISSAPTAVTISQ